MVALYFNPHAFPRAMTRAEWCVADRWRRVTQRELDVRAREQIDNLVLFGSTMPLEAYRDALHDITNPPLLIHSAADCEWCVTISPGGIATV